jgi:hypothetical protein
MSGSRVVFVACSRRESEWGTRDRGDKLRQISRTSCKMHIHTLALIVGLVLCTSCSRVPPEGTPSELRAAAAALPPALPGKSIGLPRLAGTPEVALEKIGETWSPVIHQPVPVAAGAPVVFVGWAVDEGHKATAGGVDVLVDGMPYAAEYGIERGDVADYLKFAGYKNSGFKLVLPPYEVDRGRHQVALRVLSSDGKGFYDGSYHVDFDVR